MLSLNQLLAAQGTLLVLDAASSRIQVGILASESPARWAHSDREAGIGVFVALEQLGAVVENVGAFVYCEGPGSILGVRTTAMAIRTWNVLRRRPVYGYLSLGLVAHDLGRADATIIADARRDTWHCYQLGEGLSRVSRGELGGPLLLPEHFRHWSPLPPDVSSTPYDVAAALERQRGAALFHEVEQPDAFLHEEPSYVTWTPQVHRAPGSA